MSYVCMAMSKMVCRRSSGLTTNRPQRAPLVWSLTRRNNRLSRHTYNRPRLRTWSACRASAGTVPLRRYCKATCKPPAYLLENVAMQYNFGHNHIRFPVYEDLCGRIGDPVTMDAAQAGSYAHRLRNYWTNLADGAMLHNVLDCLDVPQPTQCAKEILKPNRFPAPVTESEWSQSGRSYNVAGQPRTTFPTLMAFKGSRAFRPTKPGSIYDANMQAWTEPDADERELIMGYEVGSTAAEGVSNDTRRRLLSQTIDLDALLALLLATKGLTRNGSGKQVQVARAAPPEFCVCTAERVINAKEADNRVDPTHEPARTDADI